MMESELNQLNWEAILSSENINQKLLSFHETVLDIYQTSFPSKTRVITSENQPFFTIDLSEEDIPRFKAILLEESEF